MAESSPLRGSSFRMNRILLLLLVLGIGVSVGMIVFYALWKTECHALLQGASLRYNATLQELQLADSAYQEDISKQKLKEMKKLLETQTALAGKHQDLLEKYETSLQKVSNLQKQQDSSAQTIQSLNEQVKRLQRELGQSTVQAQQAKQNADKQTESLKSQLQLARSMMREKIDEVERLQAESPGDCSSSDSMHYQQELAELQAAIRRQDQAQCILQYGKGPYTAEFSLDFSSSETALPGDEPTMTFQVQVPALLEMSHTTYTFLKLIDLGLFKGTTLGHDNDGNSKSLVGGRPKDALNKKTQAKLTRRYAELGYGAEPLLVEESSPRAPCFENSLGMLDKGPGFSISLSHQYQDGSRSCPGKIVGGMETIERLQGLAKRERVPIVDAFIVGRPSSPEATGNDEL